MRVLHINSYYSRSGTADFYKNLFDAQVSDGLDISVFVPLPYEADPAKGNFGEYSQVVKTHNPLDRYFYHLKQGRILKEALRRFEPGRFDIIHAHSLFTNGYVAWKLKRKLGIPYIAAVRNREVNTFFRYMPHLRGTGFRIMLDASRVIFLGEACRELVLGRYTPAPCRETVMNRSAVIGNGIDGFWLRNRYRKPGRASGRSLKLLAVGQLIPLKNHLGAAKAAAVLIGRGLDVTLTVVGESRDKRILARLLEYPFVKYIPPQPKEELMKIYREADVFVLPSRLETFGLVYAEAMSQGVPVIYSRGQGFDGQFEEGVVGYHAESMNAEEIADRIVDITRNYEAISRNCVDLCGRFNWGDIAREYERIYEECTGGGQ